MAFSGIQTPITMDAAGDLDLHQFKIVDINAANRVALSAADIGFGVVQNHPRSLEAATVVHMGVTKVRAGLAVSVGNFITSAATGFGVAVLSGAAHGANIYVLGRALTGAASGALFTVAIEKTLWNVVSGAAIPA